MLETRGPPTGVQATTFGVRQPWSIKLSSIGICNYEGRVEDFSAERVTIQLQDGRTLCYAEYGNPISTSAIIYLHGLPSSRLEAALTDGIATSKDIRIIAPDRPGLGLSTRKPDRKVTDYPSDIAQLVAHLNITSFAILGVSGGAMFALSCAANRTELPGLSGIGVLAGLGPRDLTQEGMSWIQKLSFKAMDWVPKGAVAYLWDFMIGRSARNPDRTVLDRALNKAFTTGPEADVFQDERVVSLMTDSMRATFTQGAGGYADEAVLVSRPWGFELTAIKNVQVRLWYGKLDTLAPPAVGRALADKISGATCTVFDNAAHTRTIVDHLDEVLDTLRADLLQRCSYDTQFSRTTTS